MELRLKHERRDLPSTNAVVEKEENETKYVMQKNLLDETMDKWSETCRDEEWSQRRHVLTMIQVPITRGERFIYTSKTLVQKFQKLDALRSFRTSSTTQLDSWFLSGDIGLWDESTAEVLRGRHVSATHAPSVVEERCPNLLMVTTLCFASPLIRWLALTRGASLARS